jgi:hypothetical protein
MALFEAKSSDKVFLSFHFNPPSRKASAFGSRSRPTADEDGGREVKV